VNLKCGLPPSGRPVTSFRIATNWRYTTAEGERKEETEWFSVVAWGKLAEQCNQFLTKGRLVYVEGRLRLRTWDGQDGQKRARNEIIADRVKSWIDREPLLPVKVNRMKWNQLAKLSQMIYLFNWSS